MKVTFLGDVHGRWADMYARMGENLETEQFVQVGDFGHLPGLGSYIPQRGCPTPLDFIDGNHEDHFDLAEVSLDCCRHPRIAGRFGAPHCRQ